MVAERAYKLRPYQETALQEVFAALIKRPNVLLHAATGAGKTIIVCELVRRFMERWPGRRIFVLAHTEQLVRQAYDKLVKVWPEGEGKIGFACRSVSRDVSLDPPVVIGSYQTLVRRLDELPDAKLVIVDEVHRLPLKARSTLKRSAYERVLDALLKKSPELRLLGITATPFVMKHGYIYGSRCAAPERNWFPDLTYSIGIDLLQKEWFLCPLKVMETKAPNFSRIRVNDYTGDYDEGQLGEFMSAKIHLDTAVSAFLEYASDRKHAVVFAVTIEHANLLAERFAAAGIPTGVIHSNGLSPKARQAVLEKFESGEIRVLVNVAILTEGWDSPHTDCIVLCRPTKSTGLHVQIVGRGLRVCEGKEDCLVLDLVGNTEEHGDVRNPKVTWSKRKKLVCPKCRTEMWSDEIENHRWFKCSGCLTPLTVCRRCGEVNPADNTLCTACEKELYPVQGVLRCPNQECQAECSPRDIFCKVCNTRLMEEATDCAMEMRYETDFPARWLRVAAAPEARRERRNDKELLSFRVLCYDEEHDKLRRAYGTLDPEGYSEAAGRFFYVVWRSMSPRKRVPKTVQEALDRLGELRFPGRIAVARENGRNSIRNWGQDEHPWQRSSDHLDDRSRFPVVRAEASKALPGHEPDRGPLRKEALVRLPGVHAEGSGRKGPDDLQPGGQGGGGSSEVA